MASKIDVVRGVSVRKHFASGMLVYMYIDQPGVYLNTFGDEVSEKIAAEAGFEVVQLGKAKKKADMVSRYMQEVEAQLEMDTGQQSVIAERAGYKVITNGQGMSRIIADDGSALNVMPIPDEQALALLDEILPDEKAEDPEPKIEKGAKNGSTSA